MQPALIHNDYKFDNLVLSPEDLERVVAVLDWEMATIGDPLMDFGTSLGYWVESTDPEEWQRYGFGLTNRLGSFTRLELLDRYSNLSGRSIDDPVFYFAYGLLKDRGDRAADLLSISERFDPRSAVREPWGTGEGVRPVGAKGDRMQAHRPSWISNPQITQINRRNLWMDPISRFLAFRA